jgi:hypothetical protein
VDDDGGRLATTADDAAAVRPVTGDRLPTVADGGRDVGIGGGDVDGKGGGLVVGKDGDGDDDDGDDNGNGYGGINESEEEG